MSFEFGIGTKTVWSAALRVGQIYTRYVHSLEDLLGVSAGFDYLANDMVSIDPESLDGFVRVLVEALSHSNHEILRAQLLPVLLPSLVMLKRGGNPLDFLESDELAGDVETHSRIMPQ